MKSKGHEVFQQMIDKALAGGTPVLEELSLREHVESCELCQNYLSASTRGIASLSGFSFDVDPKLQRRVAESIRVRAQQLEASHMSRRRAALITMVAVLLTVAGSYTDLRFGDLLVSGTGLQHVRQGLVTFWIAPSLFLLLLFPMLPLLSSGREKVQ
jgi:predicted anti-sigma-YlaC factor YlaD